jgi:hypothetical protein
MITNIATLEAHIRSDDVRVRLRAIKLLLRHPGASPLQIVRCLCSTDLRRDESMLHLDLNDTVRLAKRRLQGVEDEAVFENLEAVFTADPLANRVIVEDILQKINTLRSATLLGKICPGNG